MTGDDEPVIAARRLDQWLWFARFAKTRSLAARLCGGGRVVVNGVPVSKPNHRVRAGDVVALRLGRWRRSVCVLALGERRGPAAEARGLYREIEAPAADPAPEWVPLLAEE